MYILVNGYKLDLSDQSISFKRKNNAFVFGKFELSRTQTLNVPITPNNRRILGFARVDEKGIPERVTYNAEMVSNAVVYKGQLYISDVTDTNYKCVFVFGDLLPLKKLSEIKSFTELLDEEYISLDAEYKANEDNLPFVGNVLYYNRNVEYNVEKNASYGWSYAKIMPSINLRELYNRINDKLPLRFNYQNIDNRLRLILGKFSSSKKNDIVFAKTYQNILAPQNDIKNIGTITNQQLICNRTGVIQQYEVSDIKSYALSNGTITFPDDFPDDLFFIADYTHYERWSGWVVADLLFFGNYSFDWEVRQRSSLANEGTRETRGIPLAGRTIDIDYSPRRYKGTNGDFIDVYPVISFFRKDDFHNMFIDSNRGHYVGFFNGDASPFNFTMPEASVNIARGTYDVPTRALLLSNLPNISPLDLFNALAVMQHSYIAYDGTQIKMQQWVEGNIVDIKKVTQSAKRIKRTALTSAQNNKIVFKDNNVATRERIVVNYAIDNENLELEKNIYTFPYSEGGVSGFDVVVNDVNEIVDENLPKWSKYDINEGEPTIAIADAGSEFMRRISFGKNDMLRRIYNASTQLTIECQMTFFEFNNIKENTIFLYSGQKFVWTDAQFNNNIVKLTLYKL
jgi:hypothetical protein